MIGHSPWKLLAGSAALLFLLSAGLMLSSCRSDAADGEIRHVVLISIDTCRADYLSCYGCSRATTPNIDGIAGQGTLFERVVSPCPLTLPAHSSLLTGTNPLHHGVHDNLDYRLGDSAVTLAEHLGRHGFTTGAIISAFVLDSKFGLSQGFDAYHDQFEAPRALPGDINERKGAEATRLAKQWLSEHRGERTFLFLHYYDPHAFYEAPEPFGSRFPNNPYAGEIAYTDHCIGQLVAHLDELGIADSTLLIITGDHGEMLGEHGEHAHGFFVYESAVKVPLIVRLPKGRTARRVQEVVGLVDVAPTICGLLEIEPLAEVQGIDLTGCIVAGEALDAERQVYCESFTATKYGGNPLLGVVTSRWKYIQTTRPELYDLVADPKEANNLVAAQPEIVALLEEDLRHTIAQQYLAVDADEEFKLDAEDRQRLASLGYVGSADVEEGLTFDASKPDPKDLVELHEAEGLLNVLMFEEQFDEAERVGNKLLERVPDHIEAHFHLAVIASKRGDVPTSITRFERILELDPAHAKTHTSLATALESQGKQDEAIQHLLQAIAADPALAEAHHNLGSLYARQNRLEAAIAAYQRAVEADANYTDAHYRLGMALSLNGQADVAVRHFRAAARQRPDWPEALNAAAWILATHPLDAIRAAPEAVRLAAHAARLTGRRNPWVLDTLAAAHAENGQFDQAVACAREALALLTSPEAAELAAKIRGRLALYEQKRPYRDTGAE